MIDHDKLLTFLLLQTVRHEVNIALLMGHVASFAAAHEEDLSLEEALQRMNTQVCNLGRDLVPICVENMEKDMGLQPGSITISLPEPGIEFDAWLRKHDFHRGVSDEQL